ncbi:contractile injection system protein, VgrG/Pvc8 family [Clostridium saccharoperbutylacetonicum]|uniref:contractile injection system protein, VgrG/Pvc8 family n=1 Tax=Clostridium saccharoperbutylacetonicum TaxID=36745 RepID=UPI00156E3AC9|nr:contractile injection system protein, VgrG/Pvc8 family [Clostridium saccharoperbutylacetonicum]
MEDFMSYNNLRISTYDVKSIEEMYIKNELNDHAVLKLTCIIDDQMKDDYVQKTDERTPIEVFYEKEEAHTSLFNGIIKNIKVITEGYVYKLFIEAKSFDYTMDIQKKKRDFQNINMTTHELIDEVMKAYSKANYDINIPNEPIGEFILQYNETDYEFLKRIVSRYNQCLICAMELQEIHLHLGTPEIPVESKTSIVNYKVSKAIEEYNDIKNNDIADALETDFITYQIRTQEIFNLGENFTFKNKQFYIKSANYTMEGANLENIYELRVKTGLKSKRLYNMNVIGISINGSILEVQRDKVKVKLEISSDIDTSTAYWFPYATVAASPDGGGWYCMPEVGERIRLNCPTKDESRAFVVNAIDSHEGKSGSEAGGDRMSNPDNKSLKTDSGQEVKFTPSGIVIECSGGQASVNLNNDGTVDVVGQNNINIACAQKLSLRAENEITISAQKSVDILCEAGSSLILSEGDEILVSGTRVQNNG